MAEIEATRSGELMVVGVQAQTEEATEFIDFYFPKRKDAKWTVVDSGRILLETRDLDAFIAEAKHDGLDVEVKEGL